MKGEGQRLVTHLTAAFDEIERLKDVYCTAIERLETFSLPNLKPPSAAQWFEMYLRVVDLGVQIRRGEIRHRTAQRLTYPCMHETGIKGAVHSGLGIDDWNAIYNKLKDQRKLAKQIQLELRVMKMDTLDRDVVGSLDKRVSRCLDNFCRRSSVFYDRLEVNGEDPHEKMLVLGGPGASVLSKITRTCFGPENCSCEEDAMPWESFHLESGDPHSPNLSKKVAGVAGTSQGEDEGMTAIKRQMGFVQLSREEKNEDAEALARDVAELARHRKPPGRGSSAIAVQRTPPSALNIYQKKCEANGSKPKPQLTELLAVKKGSHFINLSGIGFHSAEDLQDLADIFSTPGLPPVKELDVSNGFFNDAAYRALSHLLQVSILRHSVERLSLRGVAVPLRADFAVLLRLLSSENTSSTGSLPGLSSLKTLDLSFNTLCYEAMAQLKPLLAGLPRLEDLSLESCFPEPFTFPDSESSSSEESVRAALAEVSTRLDRLNFGSNCVAIDSRWLEALFTPGSTLQKLDLRGISNRPGRIVVGADSVDVDWQADGAWDLQQVETLKWSSNSSVLSEKLLVALSAELQGAFAQLKYLDMEITISSGEEDDGTRTARNVADAVTRLADYAALRSCRICLYARTGTIPHSLSASMGRLLEDGLHECEALSLRMPQLYLAPGDVRDLLSRATVPKMRKMTLAVGVAGGVRAEQNFEPYFLNMHSMQEVTLELHAPIEEQDYSCTAIHAASIALARELEASWLGRGLSSDHFEKSGFCRETGKVDRSFELSEQQKASKRIYRCRFIATPAPI